MKVLDLINYIHNTNLIEIVDEQYHRLFYGQVCEICYIDMTQIGQASVLSISPFEAQIDEYTFVPSIQIVVAVQHYCNKNTSQF